MGVKIHVCSQALSGWINMRTAGRWGCAPESWSVSWCFDPSQPHSYIRAPATVGQPMIPELMYDWHFYQQNIWGNENIIQLFYFSVEAALILTVRHGPVTPSSFNGAKLPYDCAWLTEGFGRACVHEGVLTVQLILMWVHVSSFLQFS